LQRHAALLHNIALQNVDDRRRRLHQPAKNRNIAAIIAEIRYENS